MELQADRTYRIDLQGGFSGGDGTFYNSGLLPEIVALYDADSSIVPNTSDRDGSGPGDAARVEYPAATRPLL